MTKPPMVMPLAGVKTTRGENKELTVNTARRASRGMTAKETAGHASGSAGGSKDGKKEPVKTLTPSKGLAKTASAKTLELGAGKKLNDKLKRGNSSIGTYFACLSQQSSKATLTHTRPNLSM